MAAWPEWVPALQARGGDAFVAILVLSTLMWTLIIERYWFLRRTYPGWLRYRVACWRPRHHGAPWLQERARLGFVSSVTRKLQLHLALIRALVTVLPLLGLLGTVTGMVGAFNVIADVGAGDVRVLSSGISQALVSTAAGLVTALSGLYFSVDLQSRAERELERAAGLLVGGRRHTAAT
ncbi:MAG: MotA/TolQ/ExbB proton channel family protein [Pseudomonadota bacterium]|nr:MotA/TolQ/ExbB proton channel family protein [Pseudomonadota bacterium]